MTKNHIISLKQQLGDIRSLLEIQCGSAYAIENCPALADEKILYIGTDLSTETVFENRQYFRHEKNKLFMSLDPSNEPIPKADLLICTGFAPYLPLPNIWALLKNIQESEAQYFAFDFYHTEDDKNINQALSLSEPLSASPEKRPINLCAPPFFFPLPKYLLPTHNRQYSIAVYKIQEIYLYLEWHEASISQLRHTLFEQLESDLHFLQLLFKAEPDGQGLYRAMCLGFLNMQAGDHNQAYFYDQPYHKILDQVATLAVRNDIYRLAYRLELERLHDRYPFVAEKNFVQANVLTRDYLRWKFNQPLDLFPSSDEALEGIVAKQSSEKA